MKRGEHSKWQVGGVAAVALAAVVATAFAASAAALPALDSYTPRPPSANGEPSDGVVPSGGSQSGSGSSATADATEQTQSAKDKETVDKETIDTIASSEELGAPNAGAVEAAGSSSPTEERSAPVATGSALTEPWSIAILLALAGIVVFAILRRRRGDAAQ